MNDSLPTPDYIERLQDLFEQALDRPGDEREEFLRSAAPDDEGLRNEVLALLEAHRSGDGKLPQSILSERMSAADPWIGQHVGSYEIVRLVGV